MSEISHRPCPFCSSSDGFSYSTDTGLFRCFVCEATPKNKGGLCYDGKTLTAFKDATDYEEGITLEPYVRNYRGISEAVLTQVGAYFTKTDDGQETVHWPYPTGTKHRKLPKSITMTGALSSFFGQDDYTGGKTITITEGEEDRCSVIQMLGDWPTVSVPNATPSKEFWVNARKYLANFEKIVLSIDNDGPGDELVDKFFKLFPGKVYRVNHGSYKDANEFLQAGERQEYKSAWWNAQKVKPVGINTTAEDFLKVYEETPNYEYFETKIPGLDQKMLGIHKGAVTMVLAPTGIGKTEFFRYLEYQCFIGSTYSFAFCHGEETELRSLLGLSSYELQSNVTRKDLIEEKKLEKEVKDTLIKFGDSERVYQFKIALDADVDDIVNEISFLATAMGVDFFFIEPIQDFISGDTSTKENKLTDLANKMKRMAPELNIGIVIIAHANEDGDAKYCKSLTQSVAYEIVLSRDSESEDVELRNKTLVSVGRKNRTGGGSGPCGQLTFSIDSYTLTPDVGPIEPPTPKKEKKKVTKVKDLDDEIAF